MNEHMHSMIDVTNDVILIVNWTAHVAAQIVRHHSSRHCSVSFVHDHDHPERRNVAFAMSHGTVS